MQKINVLTFFSFPWFLKSFFFSHPLSLFLYYLLNFFTPSRSPKPIESITNPPYFSIFFYPFVSSLTSHHQCHQNPSQTLAFFIYYYWMEGWDMPKTSCIFALLYCITLLCYINMIPSPILCTLKWVQNPTLKKLWNLSQTTLTIITDHVLFNFVLFSFLILLWVICST
jgi:hypothetical protein